MAKIFLTDINLGKKTLIAAAIENLGSAPSSPVTGQLYYDTVTNSLMVRNASTWISADVSQVANGFIPMAKLAVDPLARANHSGTQVASTISNFDTQVRTSRLDQMAQPTAAVPMNSQKFTGLGAPTAGSTDSARMIDVDTALQSALAGIDSKVSARMATTANHALTGLTAIDGITPIAGDRVLVKAQTAGAANGIYVAAAGAWSRAGDADANGEITPGAMWFVEEGTINAATQWRVTNTGTIVLGTTAIVITQFSAGTTYTDGDGLILSGNQFSVDPDTGIVVSASGVAVDPAVVVKKYAASVGDNSTTVFVLTHNLNTRDITVSVYLASGSYEEVECDIEHTSVNTLTARFAIAPTTNQYRVVAHG